MSKRIKFWFYIQGGLTVFIGAGINSAVHNGWGWAVAILIAFAMFWIWDNTQVFAKWHIQEIEKERHRISKQTLGMITNMTEDKHGLSVDLKFSPSFISPLSAEEVYGETRALLEGLNKPRRVEMTDEPKRQYNCEMCGHPLRLSGVGGQAWLLCDDPECDAGPIPMPED